MTLLYRNLFIASSFTLLIQATSAHAAGMVPESSLLLVKEQNQGASMNIVNTDDAPSLLYTTIVDLPDDHGVSVFVTQPVTRVEPGDIQKVRFLMKSDAPLKVEHLKRVTFEGIPPKEPGKKQIKMNFKQDLPVLIHPASLPEKKDAWTLLKWKAYGNTIEVKNDSPFVVRMSQQVQVLPAGAGAKLEKTYILPGQTLTAKTDKNISSASQVKFFPASRYGVQVPSYTANITR